MQFMNVVKFKVKPGFVEDFLQAMNAQPCWEGSLWNRTIKTGDNDFCGCGLWVSKEAMWAQMDNMVRFLDSIRDMLEEISPELGVTDAVSGPVVSENKAD